MPLWIRRTSCAIVLVVFIHSAEAQIEYQSDIVVQFSVADLDTSVEFYTQILGMELYGRNDGIGWARIRTAVPGVTIGLGVQPQSEATGSGAASVNLAVGNLDAVVDQLQRRGVRFDGPIQEIPGVVRLADFRDPDGNRIRLAGAPREAR